MTDIVAFMFLMFLASVLTGLLGPLVGIGGGILETPLLTLVFGVPVNYAIGCSIVAVIGTSCGAGSALLRDKTMNPRIATLLNSATTAGAVLGAVMTILLIGGGYKWAIYLIFGAVLWASSLSVYSRGRAEKKQSSEPVHPSSTANRFGLHGEYYDEALMQRVQYSPVRVGAGSSVVFGAGLLSGLLGIGSGTVNVLGLHSVMHLPFKVSATTSNFMIGITAAASAAIFFLKGYVNLVIVGPGAVGVVLGSIVGAMVVPKTKPAYMRLIFLVILLVSGFEMIQKGVGLL